MVLQNHANPVSGIFIWNGYMPHGKLNVFSIDFSMEGNTAMHASKMEMSCIVTIMVLFSYFSSLCCGQDGAAMMKIPPAPEIEKLMESGDFAKAETLAREKNLDKRILATILAFEKKQEDSFALFREWLGTVPESHRSEAITQCVNMLKNASPELGQEFLDLMEKEKMYTPSQGEKDCEEVMRLLKEKKISDAKKLLVVVLDSDYTGKDLVATSFSVMDYLQFAGEDKKLIYKIVETLRKKFPDDLNFRLQSIELLSVDNPEESLVQLDRLQDEQPEFYSQMDMVFTAVRAKIYDRLGETERAKAEYSSLRGTPFDSLANNKVNEYMSQEHSKQSLQDLIDKQNVPKKLLEKSSYRFWTILAVNVIGLAAIFYLIYKRGKKSNG